MSTSDPRPTSEQTPPPPAPMYDPRPYHGGPEPMLSVRPGGKIPPWVIWLSVGYGIMSLAFGVAYVAFMVWVNS